MNKCNLEKKYTHRRVSFIENNIGKLQQQQKHYDTRHIYEVFDFLYYCLYLYRD